MRPIDENWEFRDETQIENTGTIYERIQYCIDHDKPFTGNVLEKAKEICKEAIDFMTEEGIREFLQERGYF